jgi:hypothetical protein
MEPNWSGEFPFTSEAIRRNAIVSPGVYEILQSHEYQRYEGKTRVLKIGMSQSNLCQELSNHLDRHAAANRLARIRSRRGLMVTFRFVPAESGSASSVEKQLLRDFEDRHWDLPVLNSHRGYERTEDRHFRQS